MTDKKILSVAASIIKLFIILTLFNSNSKAEENNIKYYSDDMGTLALMYHRFNENKYPSTNIHMDVFEQQIKIVKDHKYIDYRQLALIDIKGNSASYTGSKTLGTNGVYQGEKCIAAGNLLSSTDVVRAMSENFSNNSNLHIAERLLVALNAGLEAGGEEGPVHSAGLKVAYKNSWPLVDLRIDWSENKPIKELINLWKSYEPQMMDYDLRATDPSQAPSYGVPGDL